MDILEMQQKKSFVERTIMKLLNDFEESTHVKIYYINFHRDTVLDERGSYIYNVELDIKL